MKKILHIKKIIPIIFIVILLQLLPSNISPAYGQYQRVGEIMHWSSSFKGNGKEGGPLCGTGGRSGVTGNFTPDAACKEAYGSDAKAGATLGAWGLIDDIVNLCDGGDTSAANINRVECVIPLPPGPPCAQWGQDGVCLKVSTSLPSGDMSSKPEEFIVKILTMVLSFAGGIALLLIISAGYKIMTSKGKPEGIQQGKEQLVSAIVGLVFIIFSFVIFQLIMVDILKIPGFTK